LPRNHFSRAVLDERSTSTKRANWQAAFALRAKHSFVLTGTRWKSCAIWSIMNFALPGYLGDRNDFREPTNYRSRVGSAPDVQRRLRAGSAVSVRRGNATSRRSAPKKIEQVVPCS